jgi:hypothetical protein
MAKSATPAAAPAAVTTQPTEVEASTQPGADQPTETQAAAPVGTVWLDKAFMSRALILKAGRVVRVAAGRVTVADDDAELQAFLQERPKEFEREG